MKWCWLSGSGCQELVLVYSSGLRFKEVSFGWVDEKHRAYDSWTGMRVASAGSGIEAKRLLLEHVLKNINSAHEQSKVLFGERGEAP